MREIIWGNWYMDKYQNDLNRIPVAIIIEDGAAEVERYITEKIIAFGGEVIKEDNLYNNFNATIIYTSNLEKVRKEALNGNFHQVFWKKDLSKTDNIFIAFDSKRYILGFSGCLNTLKKTIDENLESMIKQIKLIKDGKHVDKKDCNYSMWGKK